MDKYAIIDWLQSSDDKTDIVKTRATINKLAKREHLETETLKSVCIREHQYNTRSEDEPDAETLRALKIRGRNNYNADAVVIVTDAPHKWYNKANIEKWALRHKELYTIDFSYDRPKTEKVELFEETHNIDIFGTADETDIYIDKWFRAFGIQLSAPPIINYNGTQRDNDITMRANRPHAQTEALKRNGERHYTKPSSNAEAYLEQERCKYTDKEKAEAKAQIDFYLDAIDNGTMTEREALDIDYILCPHTKGKARERHATRIHYTEGFCFCDVCGKPIDHIEEIASSSDIFYNLITKGELF